MGEWGDRRFLKKVAGATFGLKKRLNSPADDARKGFELEGKNVPRPAGGCHCDW
jgi:hypothetical protein